jgi:LysM repeat protein
MRARRCRNEERSSLINTSLERGDAETSNVMKLFQQFRFPGLKRPKRRKKLRAATGRRSVRAATADYEELSEPNMKLSRALLIVLLLHVVAVSGIIAFNAIKTRQASSTAPTYVGVTPGSPITTAASPSEHIKRALPAADTADGSHKTYIVAKGDNPVTIARKFKVSYDELLALNHIDDPRKLRVGQKLLIPNRTARGKKAD